MHPELSSHLPGLLRLSVLGQRISVACPDVTLREILVANFDAMAAADDGAPALLEYRVEFRGAQSGIALLRAEWRKRAGHGHRGRLSLRARKGYHGRTAEATRRTLLPAFRGGGLERRVLSARCRLREWKIDHDVGPPPSRLRLPQRRTQSDRPPVDGWSTRIRMRSASSGRRRRTIDCRKTSSISAAPFTSRCGRCRVRSLQGRCHFAAYCS